ncbi:MAG: hypothetical protein Tsb0013_02580 [Phycisphaerales bacterium]
MSAQRPDLFDPNIDIGGFAQSFAIDLAPYAIAAVTAAAALFIVGRGWFLVSFFFGWRVQVFAWLIRLAMKPSKSTNKE